MRFITESELRTAYKTHPFSSYQLDTSMRLTPGAKQFLVDFRIKILAPESVTEKTAMAGKKSGVVSVTAQVLPEQQVQCWHGHLQRLEAQLLLHAYALNEKTPLYAREIQKMVRLLKNMRLHADVLPQCKEVPKALQTIETLVDISDIHMTHPQGEVLLTLHLIVCELNAFLLDLNQFEGAFQALNHESVLYENYISQMIYTCQAMMAECDGGAQ